MANYAIFSVLFLIVLMSSGNYVSALTMESILNGKSEENMHFTYQAAIIGREKDAREDEESFACNAAILDNFFLLGVAHCLYNRDGTLKELNFAVIVGATFANLKNNVKIQVYKIYTNLFDPETFDNDVAVLRVRRSLDLDKNWHLDAIPVADSDKLLNLISREGIVTGYGVHKIETTTEDGVVKRTGVTIDFRLRSGRVVIVGMDKCENAFPNIQNPGTLCALMLPNDEGENTGACLCDSGSPLVIANTLVGISSKHKTLCDDSTEGSIYVDVSQFKSFIDAVIKGRSYPNVRIDKNNVYAVYLD